MMAGAYLALLGSEEIHSGVASYLADESFLLSLLARSTLG